MNTRIKADIITRARATPDSEVCGLIYQTLEGVHVLPSPNVARDEEGAPEVDEAFEVAPQVYAEAASLGRVIGVYHSHRATGSTALSEADLDMARALELPVYLYCNRDESWHSYIPPGYHVPLTGLPFAWGVADCYEEIRTYYRQTLGIYLGDYDRDETFALQGDDRLVRHIADEGFTVVPGKSQLHLHDVLLFRTPGYAAPHHVGVFVGHSRVLHHPLNQLSRYDPLNGEWFKRLRMVLRHNRSVSPAV